MRLLGIIWNWIFSRMMDYLVKISFYECSVIHLNNFLDLRCKI